MAILRYLFKKPIHKLNIPYFYDPIFATPIESGLAEPLSLIQSVSSSHSEPFSSQHAHGGVWHQPGSLV